MIICTVLSPVSHQGSQTFSLWSGQAEKRLITHCHLNILPTILYLNILWKKINRNKTKKNKDIESVWWFLFFLMQALNGGVDQQVHQQFLSIICKDVSGFPCLIRYFTGQALQGNVITRHWQAKLQSNQRRRNWSVSWENERYKFLRWHLFVPQGWKLQKQSR